MERVVKEIDGYEGRYEVDELGNIYSNAGKEKKRLKPQSNGKRGYLQVFLSFNDERKQRLVHRLVAEAFIPNPNNLPQVNHKDGDKTNNNVSNLEWCTRKENVQHGYDTGLIIALRGEYNLRSKLTETEVLAIRTKYASGEYSQTELSREFKVASSTISEVINMNRWKHI